MITRRKFFGLVVGGVVAGIGAAWPGRRAKADRFCTSYLGAARMDEAGACLVRRDDPGGRRYTYREVDREVVEAYKDAISAPWEA